MYVYICIYIYILYIHIYIYIYIYIHLYVHIYVHCPFLYVFRAARPDGRKNEGANHQHPMYGQGTCIDSKGWTFTGALSLN